MVIDRVSNRSCPECNKGHMKQPYPPHTYDYNQDGWVSFYCTICGCGYKEYVVGAVIVDYGISNHKLKAILDEIGKKEKIISYTSKKFLYHRLKNLNLMVDSLAKEIISVSKGLQFQSVLDVIYKNLR